MSRDNPFGHIKKRQRVWDEFNTAFDIKKWLHLSREVFLFPIWRTQPTSRHKYYILISL